MRGRKSAQLLVLCSSYSICCEMPILILNVTTGVTFKYKYHKLASLTSQSGEYSWLLLQITESTAQFSQSASRHKTFCYVYQWPVTTGNAINMRCVVFCAGAKYMTPWLPPSSLSPGRQILISSFWRCPSDLISSACCNNWHWRTHTLLQIFIILALSNKTQAAIRSIIISLSPHPSRLEQKSEFSLI